MTIQNWANAKEEESRYIIQDSLLPDKEIAVQVYNFLGYALGRLLNNTSTIRNNVSEDYDYSAEEILIELIITTREEYLKSVILH